LFWVVFTTCAQRLLHFFLMQNAWAMIRTRSADNCAAFRTNPAK
jgi:hypothetical protein